MANHTYQTVIDAVNAILDTSLEDYTEKVIDRLVSFSYVPTVDNAFIIAFAIQSQYLRVNNIINQPPVEQLDCVVIDMMVGKIFHDLKSVGKLNITGIVFPSMGSQKVSSVKEGDTQVNYDTSSTSEFDVFVTDLLDGHLDELFAFRCIKW